MAHNISEAEVTRAVQALRAKGIPDDQIAEVIGAMSYGEPRMSKTDGVTITQSEPDVPGFYIDATQRLQDAYAQTPMAQRQIASGMQQVPAYFNSIGDMNLRPVPLSNPNARVEEARTTTVDANGNIVIY